MSVSSAGANLQYSATDIAVNAVTGWTNVGCILSLERGPSTLEIGTDQGCLSDAINAPVVPVHKTAGATDEGQIDLTLEFTGATYDLLNDLRKAGTQTYFRVVDPDTRNSSGVLQPATCSLEKVFGWVTSISKSSPEGGGRMTISCTITVETSTYTPKT